MIEQEQPRPGEWRTDPVNPSRKRYWNGTGWTRHVVEGDHQFEEPYTDCHRWQYGVATIGSFRTPDKLTKVLGGLGEQGWELVTVYDKSANWIVGLEQGFVLFKRPIEPGVEIPSNEWCVTIRM